MSYVHNPYKNEVFKHHVLNEKTPIFNLTFQNVNIGTREINAASEDVSFNWDSA